MLVRRCVDLAPKAPAPNIDSCSCGINTDRPERREIDHDSLVNARKPGAIVAAAAYCKGQIAFARKADHSCDIVGVGAARDKRRPFVDHGVVERPRFVVGRVGGADQVSAEPCQVRASSRDGICIRVHHALRRIGVRVSLVPPRARCLTASRRS